MAEQSRIPEPGAGRSPPSPRASHKKRLLDSPANDNAQSAGQRILRAAIFVVVGGVLAWLLREIFG